MTKPSKSDNRKKGKGALREESVGYGVRVARKQNRKVDEETAREMAALVAKRLTETGAALMLGIEPEVWFAWKSRNQAKFSQVLTHVREAKLNACLEAIDEAGDGCADKGIRADWRAKAYLVDRVIAPERYGQRQESPQPASLTITIADSLVRQIYGDATTPVIDVTPNAPMLPDTTMQASPDTVSNLDTVSHVTPIQAPVTDKAASGNASDSIVIDKD